MRRRITAVVFAAALGLGLGAPAATAHHRDGHTANLPGLCNAAQRGSENGQGKKRENGNAFQELQARADDAEADSLEAFCDAYPLPPDGDDS